MAAARADFIATTFVQLECGNAAAHRPYRSAVGRLRRQRDEGNRWISPTTADWTSAWAVLSFSPRTGAFASTNGLSLGNGLRLVPAFGPTALTLTATGSGVTPPTLTFSRDANGLFRLQWQGNAGQTYRLVASTNLVDWDSLFATNAPGGVLDFTDPASATLPWRFYRVVVP